MEKTSKLEDLREEIANLSKLIDQKLMILANVNCNDTEFLKSIQNDFSQNLNFTISFIKGLQKPEKTYISHGVSKKCYHGNDSPHLYHTFNPQLNTIVVRPRIFEKSNFELISNHIYLCTFLSLEIILLKIIKASFGLIEFEIN